MKNATDQADTTIWPTRNEAAEPIRTRDMPLLFQLADVNRLPVVSPASTAPPVIAPGPGPLEMPPLPGSFPSTASPLASNAIDSWSRTPPGLFEMPSSFSTAGLSSGAAAPETAIQTPEKAPSAPKPAELPSLPTEPVADQLDQLVDSLLTAKTGAEPEPVSVNNSTLPKAIDTAVKTAAVVVDAQETTKGKVSANSESTTTITPTAASETSSPSPTNATTDKPSPGSLRRQRADVRQQKATGQKGDWLQSHGKIIAIGFVLALIGTIYLARRNQPSPEVAPANDPPMGLAVEMPGEHDGHDHKPAEAANIAPRLVEAPSHPHDSTPSPALSAPAGNPNATATAELQPPVMPPPSGTTPPASGAPLFPWQNETRTATRPDAPTLPATTPNANGPAPNQSNYPETNLRDAPLLPPAPLSAPAAPASSGGQGTGRAPSRSYPASFTSAPGGTRYERTGSGLY